MFELMTKCSYLPERLLSRGHVPIMIDLTHQTKPPKNVVKKKLDIKNMDWLSWRLDIDNRLSRVAINNINDPTELWNLIHTALISSSERNCPTKVVSSQSKPYWSETLSLLSDVLKEKQRTFLTRNTDNNLKEFQEAKHNLKKQERWLVKTS